VRAASIVPFIVFFFGVLSTIVVFTTHSKNETTTQVHHADPRDTKEVDNGVMLERTTTKERHGHAV